jgi:hypothetical protein
LSSDFEPPQRHRCLLCRWFRRAMNDTIPTCDTRTVGPILARKSIELKSSAVRSTGCPTFWCRGLVVAGQSQRGGRRIPSFRLNGPKEPCKPIWGPDMRLGVCREAAKPKVPSFIVSSTLIIPERPDSVTRRLLRHLLPIHKSARQGSRTAISRARVFR